ncbi:hypothetical protein Caci_4055 [Catenulispora acidiphila DSM 44928]|uniref:Uncharacterized protein n=1 Tax=Catenulispora acidiphila (strain DSM 44928 / JCM 14897 / NBRC 102108 / NRRL B-24433 / ID139908) TaxID=479433 RepID=C7QG75_CATAD|nr:hypothetical protein [Catenulispora acidiphila]ACU72920.1 hypothetical protein Caci_4055 [Catenulispora acidiphila DSM 44928]
MPITAEQLEGIATGFHGIAEQHFTANGRVVPALWFIPDAGTARLVEMPQGVIDREQTAQIARTDRPSAILLAGESWMGSVTIPVEAAKKLPIDDIPRPSQQPDRREVISTFGVGRAHDGSSLHVMRATLILRTVFGTQLVPFDLNPDAEREDDYAAFLASLLPGPAQPKRRR